MSDKKDDHGGGDKKKKTLPATLIGISLAVLAILVFLIFNSITVPEMFNAGAQLVSGTAQGFHNLGGSFSQLGSGIRHFSHGVKDTLVAVLMFVLVAGIIGLIIFYVIKLFFGKKKDDGHGDHGHGHAEAKH